jgi:predicted Zn-dependent protease
MKMGIRRWGPVAVVALLLAAALFVAEWRQVKTRPSASALLYMLADGQRELTRLQVAFSPLSDAEEIRIGDTLAHYYRGMTADNSTDPRAVEVRNYVEAVGTRLAARAHRKLPYRFHYIPNPYFVNAFAIPGGHVYIGAGLLELMHSEDEMAAVLGHEIEHIDHRHAAERTQMEAALRRLPLSGLLAIPVEVFEAGYTKDEELEADREGTRLAVSAGYSPSGAIEMFEAYQKVERQITHESQPRPEDPVEELSRVSIEMLTGYFRSHPANSDRIAQIRSLIAEEHWNPSQPERPLAVAYMFLAARAAHSLERRDYKTAGELASQSLAQSPGYPLALSILAQAEIAQENYAAANDAYHQLVARNPAEADAVRKFADGLAETSIQNGHYKKAEELAQESLALQPGRTQAMVMLAEARLALADFGGASETARNLQNVNAGAVGQLLSYAGILGHRALTLGQFDQAANYASFRLEFSPGDAGAVIDLAEAEYAGGGFASAAAAYRKLLDAEIARHQPLVYGYVVEYSEALGAARLGGGGVAAFEDFLAHAGRQDEERARPR